MSDRVLNRLILAAAAFLCAAILFAPMISHYLTKWAEYPVADPCPAGMICDIKTGKPLPSSWYAGSKCLEPGAINVEIHQPTSAAPLGWITCVIP